MSDKLSSSALSLPELWSRPRNLRRPRQLAQLDRGEAGLGRRRDAWPLLRPARTLKRRQPAARPRILHSRRHDLAERARCRGLVRAACEGRLWPQQVHQTDLKACRRRAVVARAETAAEEPSAVASQRLPGSRVTRIQVVALAHSDQGGALVGLYLSMCEVGVRAGGVCELVMCV